LERTNKERHGKESLIFAKTCKKLLFFWDVKTKESLSGNAVRQSFFLGNATQHIGKRTPYHTLQRYRDVGGAALLPLALKALNIPKE